MVDVDRNKISFIFLGILVLVAVGVVLKYAGAAILPLIIAWLFSFLIGPLVNFMTDRKVPATLAVFIVLICLVGVIYLSGTFLYTRLTAFAAAELLENLSHQLEQFLSHFFVHQAPPAGLLRSSSGSQA